MSRNEIFKNSFEENKYTNQSTLHPLVIKTGNYSFKIQYCTNNKKSSETKQISHL